MLEEETINLELEEEKTSSILRDKRFFSFLGSGLIVSVAYMDPGNWGTNISGGAFFNYELLWVIWLANGMAMLFQYLSGKIGIAGYSVPELVRLRLKKKHYVFSYWLLSELVVLATDIAEFLGIVIALHLLFGIPLLISAFIAVLDVLLILGFTKKRFRLLEHFFVLFVSIIGIGFLYEVIISQPNISAFVYHSVKPTLRDEAMFVIVGIIGATVMPHALFVHSWLTQRKTRKLIKRTPRKLLVKFHMIDNIVSLFIAGLINAAMLTMAAASFYGRGLNVSSLEDAYLILKPLFGEIAAIVFAIALLSAGISSSITGVLSGDAIMHGLIGKRVNLWIRRIVTRVINLIPIVIAILLNIEPLFVLVLSQVILSLLIPLPMIPIILFSADKKLMGDLANKEITTIISIILALIIIGFNAYLLYLFFFHGVSLE